MEESENELTRQKQLVEAGLVSTEQMKEQLDQEIHGLKKDCETERNEVQKLLDQIQVFESEVHSLEQELASVRDQSHFDLEQLKKQLEQMTHNHAAVTAELQNLQD